MTTLTERYVDAAMRTVPERQRADLAAELRASIDDQVDARVAEGEPPAVAERAVLTALGDPDVLAAGYVDRPLHLIGPRYFLTWWRLTTLLWAIVPACAALGVAVAQVLSGATVGEVIGAVVGVVIAVVVHVGFWTTAVFAIVERTSGSSVAGVTKGWTLEDLPARKDRGATLSDLVASLIFAALLAGALVWDRFVGFVYLGEDGWTSFLAPDLWPWWAAAFFVALGAGAALVVWVYARGRWTFAAAGVNLVLDAVVASAAVWLLVNDRLIDPAFFPGVLAEDGESVHAVISVLSGFAIVAIAAWDAVDGFLKARRRPAASGAPI